MLAFSAIIAKISPGCEISPGYRNSIHTLKKLSIVPERSISNALVFMEIMHCWFISFCLLRPIIWANDTYRRSRDCPPRGKGWRAHSRKNINSNFGKFDEHKEKEKGDIKLRMFSSTSVTMVRPQHFPFTIFNSRTPKSLFYRISYFINHINIMA